MKCPVVLKVRPPALDEVALLEENAFLFEERDFVERGRANLQHHRALHRLALAAEGGAGGDVGLVGISGGSSGVALEDDRRAHAAQLLDRLRGRGDSPFPWRSLSWNSDSNVRLRVRADGTLTAAGGAVARKRRRMAGGQGSRL